MRSSEDSARVAVVGLWYSGLGLTAQSQVLELVVRLMDQHIPRSRTAK